MSKNLQKSTNQLQEQHAFGSLCSPLDYPAYGHLQEGSLHSGNLPTFQTAPLSLTRLAILRQHADQSHTDTPKQDVKLTKLEAV